MDTYSINGKYFLSVHGIKKIIEKSVGKLDIHHMQDGGIIVMCTNADKIVFSRSLTGDELTAKIRSSRKYMSQKLILSEKIRTVHSIRYAFYEMINAGLIHIKQIF